MDAFTPSREMLARAQMREQYDDLERRLDHWRLELNLKAIVLAEHALWVYATDSREPMTLTPLREVLARA